jgi:hypothetical protein
LEAPTDVRPSGQLCFRAFFERSFTMVLLRTRAATRS